MKTILLIIGLAAVVTACVLIPKPRVKFSSAKDKYTYLLMLDSNAVSK